MGRVNCSAVVTQSKVMQREGEGGGGGGRGRRGDCSAVVTQSKETVSSTNLHILLDHVEVYWLRDDAVVLRIVLEKEESWFNL